MRILALSAVATVALSSCVSYTAQVERDVKRGDVEVAVKSASARRALPPETRVEIVVRHIPAGTKLLAASFRTDVDPVTSPALCDGFRASKLGRVPANAANAPLTPSERIILSFESLSLDEVARKEPHLELLLETPNGRQRCVAVPLTDRHGELDWSLDQRFTVGLDASLEGYTSWLGPVSHVLTLQLQLGAWFGRLHVEADAGYAGAGCPDSRCPAPSESQHVNFTSAWPLSLGVRTPIWERGEISFGGGLRYRTIRLAAHTFQGRETFWAHGPVVAPYFGVGMQKRGTAGGSRDMLMAFEVPVGYAFAANGQKSLSIGVNLTAFFTSF